LDTKKRKKKKKEEQPVVFKGTRGKGRLRGKEPCQEKLSSTLKKGLKGTVWKWSLTGKKEWTEGKGTGQKE